MQAFFGKKSPILSLLFFIIIRNACAHPLIYRNIFIKNQILYINIMLSAWIILILFGMIFFRRIRHAPFLIYLLMTSLLFREYLLSGNFLVHGVWPFYLLWTLFIMILKSNLAGRGERCFEIVVGSIFLVLLAALGLHVRETHTLHGSFVIMELFYYFLNMGACLIALAVIMIGTILQQAVCGTKKHRETGRKDYLFGAPALVFFFLAPFAGAVLMPLLVYKTPRFSRIKADQRSLANGIMAYFVDHGEYPRYITGHEHSANGFIRDPMVWEKGLKGVPTFEIPDGRSLATLTTPLAYITGYFVDSFFPVKGTIFAYYSVNDPDDPKKSGWIVWSAGVDGDYDLDIDAVRRVYNPRINQPSQALLDYSYDPTNGMYSSGDIFRVYF